MCLHNVLSGLCQINPPLEALRILSQSRPDQSPFYIQLAYTRWLNIQLKFRYYEKAIKIHPIFHFLVDITQQRQIISRRWYKFLWLSQNIRTLGLERVILDQYLGSLVPICKGLFSLGIRLRDYSLHLQYFQDCFCSFNGIPLNSYRYLNSDRSYITSAH